MIQVEFEFDKKLDWLTPRPKDKKYIALEAIGNIGWTSDRVIEDIEAVERCKLGTYIEEDNGPDVYRNESYSIGIENSPGIIYALNWGPAHVFDFWDKKKGSLLELTLDELLDFLTQMRDFLISVGR